MADLKPCPFCAGEADSEWYRDYRHIRSGEIGRSIAVYCTACHADMTICRADVPELSADDIMAMLVEGWNRRDAVASTPESGTQAAAALSPLRAEVLEFLDGVVGVVEANRFEQMMLWSENRRHESPKAWVEHLSGFGQTIGFVGDMPVFVSLLTAEVQGQKILFAHATSQVVDHRMVDAWLKANMPQSAFWPDGRLNFVDADNFHNVFRAPAPAEARGDQPSPQAAAWIMRDWDAGKIDVTLSPDERDLWERRGAKIEPLYALPTPPKA